MPNFVFSVRRIRSGAFQPEPGSTHFLSVPDLSTDIHPAHKATSKAAWVKAVMEEAKSGVNPNTGRDRGDIVVYVHGFNTETRIMLERHKKIEAGLSANGFKGVVVSFDWPSASSALNYLEDRSDAKETARRLVDEGIRTFAAIQDPGCEINLHILAHSMGAFVVREAFDDADDRPAIAAHSWSVSQVLLMSGDVSAGSLTDNNAKSSSLYRHCVRLTNYNNPFDNVLSLADVKRIGVAPRVGRIGLPGGAPSKAVNVDCGAYFDANKDNFDHLRFPAHTWYFDDPVLMRDAALTIAGQIDRHRLPTRSAGAGAAGDLTLIA